MVEQNTDLVLINITGADQPGLTSTIAELLGEAGVEILDIGQAVIHNYLTLGLLTHLPNNGEAVFKEILFRAHELDVAVNFTPISADSYGDWVALQGRPRFILTLLGRRIRAADMAEVTRLVAARGMNIDNITRLSGRVSLAQDDDSVQCIEMSLRGEPAALRTELMTIAADRDIDVAIQEDSLFRRHRRLVAFDMDSTLIDAEVIDELAAVAGVGAQVAAITERAMRGELDFQQSLRERVAMLKGLPETALAEVAESLRLMEGAERLFQTLNRLGYKTAVLSGGFDYFGEVLQRRLGIDYVYANKLEIADGRLTGKVLAPIVDGERKAMLLKDIAARENITLEQTIAVGDGANDLPMLGIAGLGIAFHAKPMVRESARHSISTLGLDSILYLMGLRDRDQNQRSSSEKS